MRAMKAAGLVLCYHAVSDDWDHALSVTPTALERQLRALLRRGFTPFPAAELPAGRRRGLHVTFDDAYANVLQAAPMLQRLGVHATIFAISSLADDGAPMNVPELAAELVANPQHLATMTWDDLRGLAESGFEIGAHTVTHPHLPALSDAELDRELGESRTQVEDQLGRPCRLLAYPFGEHDPRVQAASRRAGYAAAFALAAGASARNPFAVPRTDIYRRDSLARMMLKTTFVKPGAARMLSRVRARPAP